jgi:hypothetical protein
MLYLVMLSYYERYKQIVAAIDPVNESSRFFAGHERCKYHIYRKSLYPVYCGKCLHCIGWSVNCVNWQTKNNKPDGKPKEF